MNEVLKVINEKTVDILRETLKIGDAAFNLWFEGFTLVSLDDKLAVFSVPSNVGKSVLLSRYYTFIKDALSVVLGFEVQVDIYSLEDTENKEKEKIVIYDSSSEEVEYERELEVERREMGKSLLSDEDLDFLSQSSPSKKSEKYDSLDKKSTLSQYTFDNFIEGDSNRFAKAACMGVVQEPGFSYNPLFIYGNSGLGKTHLLYATISEIKKLHPELKIVYKKCESFVNELVLAIKQGSTDVFKEKYRSCDVLLIDDIQFIAGKDLCQEEFFHTFSCLYEDDKQIILTSDRPPNEINPLTDRLRSRFEGGLLADVKIPGFELRAAITKKKADTMGLNIPDDLIYYMAQRLRVNIRQIEGVLKKIKMVCGLSGTLVSKQMVEESIISVDPLNMPNDILIERTLNEVSKKYGVSVEDLKSKKRTDSIAKARHIAIYLIKELLEEISLKEVGRIFGDRDHTTVLSSINKVKQDIRTVNGVEEDIKKLIFNIKGHLM